MTHILGVTTSISTSSTGFDTFAYGKKLRATGFNEQQTEALEEAQAELVDERLATKHDLRKIEYRLTIRLGTLLIVAIGIIATLVKTL